jgi:hypothetical protein
MGDSCQQHVAMGNDSTAVIPQVAIAVADVQQVDCPAPQMLQPLLAMERKIFGKAGAW